MREDPQRQTHENETGTTLERISSSERARKHQSSNHSKYQYEIRQSGENGSSIGIGNSSDTCDKQSKTNDHREKRRSTLTNLKSIHCKCENAKSANTRNKTKYRGKKVVGINIIDCHKSISDDSKSCGKCYDLKSRTTKVLGLTLSTELVHCDANSSKSANSYDKGSNNWNKIIGVNALHNLYCRSDCENGCCHSRDVKNETVNPLLISRLIGSAMANKSIKTTNSDSDAHDCIGRILELRRVERRNKNHSTGKNRN